MAGIVAVAMLAAGAPMAAAGEESQDGQADSVYALDDGEELYLVFGADLGDMSLEEYIDAYASGEQDVDAEISQYQDVDQVNINQQANATSISIDGGEATAVQEASQQNSNDQLADAGANASQGEETQFEDVGDVTVLIGDGDGKQFSGWGIADKKGDKSEVDADQAASAEVVQAQEVAQLNYNEQNVAFALAENGSEATALQQSQQSNQNLQQGVANATNVYAGDGDFTDQAADASVEQAQAAEQMNYNEQDGAVAIAVGEDSVATAIQITEQTNLNEQIGIADAEDVITQLGGMSVATAGVEDGDGGVIDSERAVETLHGDKKDDKHKKTSEGVQTATSEVTQSQSAEQMNVNLQSTAMAIATNGSDATAVQLAYQDNVNSQVGFADALNVYAGPSHLYENAVVTETTSVTVGGEDVDGIEGLSYDYDASQTNDAEQHASAQLEQVQFISQENINEQQAAIAVAENGETASAAQVSMQENENVQFGSVASTNVWASA